MLKDMLSAVILSFLILKKMNENILFLKSYGVRCKYE